MVYMPFVVVAELRAGFASGERAAENLEFLEPFLQSEFVEVLHSDSETLQIYAQLFTSLRRRGTPIPTNDLWIASLCVRHHLPLDTADTHFRNVDLLKLVNVE